MRIKKTIVTVMITIMTIIKGNNCNKRDLTDFWKGNCKDFKAVTFQKSGKKYFLFLKSP